MNGLMRKLPGVPELLGKGSGSLLDAVAIYRARFVGHSLVDPLRPFENARWNWRGFSVPNSNLQAVPSRGATEDQISVKPGSFLVSISAVSDQPEGFRWLLTDRGTRQTLSAEWSQHLAESGGLGAKFPTRALPLYLCAPWAVSDAGLLMVQITNLSAAINNINLLFVFAEPA